MAKDTFPPIRASGLKVADFAAWLAKCGAEIGVPTNPYEMIRYRIYSAAGKLGTHIVYRKESDVITWAGESFGHYQRFLDDRPLTPTKAEVPFVKKDGSLFGRPDTSDAPTSQGQRLRRKLLDRDGDECWFCGIAMGDDCTIEHLVPKSDGGRNSLSNYALAHEACNRAAANRPLVTKIEMRTKMRSAKVTS